MIAAFLIFLGPAVLVCGWLALVEAGAHLVRMVDDRHSARLVARYRNVTRVSVIPSDEFSDEQERARRTVRRDLQALRDFYGEADAQARYQRWLSVEWRRWVASLPETPVRRSSWG